MVIAIFYDKIVVRLSWLFSKNFNALGIFENRLGFGEK